MRGYSPVCQTDRALGATPVRPYGQQRLRKRQQPLGNYPRSGRNCSTANNSGLGDRFPRKPPEAQIRRVGSSNNDASGSLAMTSRLLTGAWIASPTRHLFVKTSCGQTFSLPAAGKPGTTPAAAATRWRLRKMHRELCRAPRIAQGSPADRGARQFRCRRSTTAALKLRIVAEETTDLPHRQIFPAPAVQLTETSLFFQHTTCVPMRRARLIPANACRRANFPPSLVADQILPAACLPRASRLVFIAIKRRKQWQWVDKTVKSSLSIASHHVCGALRQPARPLRPAAQAECTTNGTRWRASAASSLYFCQPLL